MNSILYYLLEVVLTLIVSLLIAAYLRPFLRQILVDLCGTIERAQFWTTFSNILLIGLPTLIALNYQPEAATTEELFFEIARRLSGNLISLLIALVLTGLTVAFFALVAPRTTRETE
jgi:hypothetical protein